MNIFLDALPGNHKPPGGPDFYSWINHSIFVYIAIALTTAFSIGTISNSPCKQSGTLMIFSWVTMWLIWRTDSAEIDAVTWIICFFQIVFAALPFGMVKSRS